MNKKATCCQLLSINCRCENNKNTMSKNILPSDKSDHKPPKRILTSKVVETPESGPCESTKPLNPLDVINQNRSCNCDVVARGIRDHVHMNIGMSERRDPIKRLTDECIARCDQKCKESPELEPECKMDTDKKPADKKPSADKKSDSKTDVKKDTCKICGSISK